ncbi:gamma-glutamyl hydrolase 2-like isoform X2 [Salvia miltiorrhiza]|uniref:gamma-glutamyl hydrolase 2-like isoform X2 n=1 Tax=Salvia miltiorrhiza TaxID=226208 RepID=UPI0025ACBFB5|nr:gamma-glutamyl hydrolase 2-like isoform X2 [Salvia miltiorrhiza]
MAPPPPPPLSTSDSTASDSPESTSSPVDSSASGMLNYRRFPLLVPLCKELSGSAAAQSTAARQLLQTQTDASAPRITSAGRNLNFRPVIGILSHPGDGASGRLNNAPNVSYIAASYSKFVESAGARVIPLIYNEPWEVLYGKLSLVNGVIFTGGWAKKGLYAEVVESIFKEVLRKNDAGDHYPLLAICLGFELVIKIVSEDNMILERFNAVDQASTLQFVENINMNGTVFHRFPPTLLKKLSTDCLVMQHHKFGISPEKFQNNKRLSSFFKILATSADEDGKVYVSTVQARRYPVTGVQFHPEKNSFEWGLQGIPHSEDAVQVTQHIANFLVREARMSSNRPSSKEVLDNLIYNYTPTYCGKSGSLSLSLSLHFVVSVRWGRKEYEDK